MLTRGFERMSSLVQMLAAVVFGACVLVEHAQAQPASPDATAAASFQSIQSRYRASTELQTHNTCNTKHNTYNTKHRSKC
jgi:hypothetical protein